MYYFCSLVHKRINNVIKKGRGNRPVEALATLYLVKKVLRSTQFFNEYGKITKSVFFTFLDNIQI